MKDEAIDESLAMDIANDNVAYAILNMLAQKNLKLGPGMLELDYDVRGSYRLVVKGCSVLYERGVGPGLLCPIFPIIFYDVAKTDPYACALSTMLQRTKNGIMIVAIDDSYDETMVFIKSGTTYEQLLVELDLCLNTR